MLDGAPQQLVGDALAPLRAWDPEADDRPDMLIRCLLRGRTDTARPHDAAVLRAWRDAGPADRPAVAIGEEAPLRTRLDDRVHLRAVAVAAVLDATGSFRRCLSPPGAP